MCQEEEMGAADRQDSLGACWHMSHTCPCLVPASPGSGCRGACQLERNTPGSKPPWHPGSPPHAQTSGRREVGWD